MNTAVLGAGEDIGQPDSGILAMLNTPQHVVVTQVDQGGGPKTKLMYYDRAAKAKIGETNIPARMVANGLAIAGGRLYVTLENGEVAIIGG